MYKLRPHQIKFSNLCYEVLKKYSIVYLAGEVRSNKTGTALQTAKLLNCEKVLVITKKKAISSIESDYKNFGFAYDLTCINYESLHKLENNKFDLVIYDEAHSLGAYPKPSQRTKLCKKLFYGIPCILMSGTPSPESKSQLYHQFHVSIFNPFKEFANFYKWAKVYVDKKEVKLPTHTIADYSHAKDDLIDKQIKPYLVKMTQQDAGFQIKINEHILKIPLPTQLNKLGKRLLKDKAIEGLSGYILGDTPSKLKSKLHQIHNGSCIIERAEGDTKTVVFSKYKANYIKQYFKNKKIAIMYYFQAELDILKATFGGGITTDLETFNSKDVNLAIQQNTTEGLNLSKADCLVYYNLGYSGKNFIQSRDRLTVKNRKSNDVYFVIEDGGITGNILKAVREKKDYNNKAFKKDYHG